MTDAVMREATANRRARPARGAEEAALKRTITGFTLVELLVVIAIISALAGLLVPMVKTAKVKAKKKNASNDINVLSLAMETYMTDWGDYPPTSLEVYDAGTNGINDGIESLLAHLTSRRKGGPYYEEYKEEQLENLDNDSLTNDELRAEINWIFGDAQLRELVDPFGNPYVYIHNGDYEYSYQYQLGEEYESKKVSVMAGRSAKTATFYAPLKFQIWSFGPNGRNDTSSEDEGDDIGSW